MSNQSVLTKDEFKSVEKHLARRNQLSFVMTKQLKDIYENGVVKANNVLVVADMHLEYSYNKAMHIDYAQNCRNVMKNVLDEVRNGDIKVIIFLGDFIGVKTGVGFIKNRDFFQEVLDFMLDLMSLGALPIILRGNHDLYQPSDYDFLIKYGFALNPHTFKDQKLTILPEEGTSDLLFELHFVQYGDEDRNLHLTPKDDVSTVVLAHNNFYVRGQDEFYVTEKAIDVTTHLPFTNADMILTGDIHVPSSTLLDFKYSNGNEGTFLNLGCPTRPQRAPKYDYVFTVKLGYSNNNPTLEFPPMELAPYDETFVQTIDAKAIEQIEEMNRSATEDRRRNLESVLKNVGSLETSDRDYFHTIDSIAFVNDNVKEMAKSYITRAKIEN